MTVQKRTFPFANASVMRLELPPKVSVFCDKFAGSRFRLLPFSANS